MSQKSKSIGRLFDLFLHERQFSMKGNFLKKQYDFSKAIIHKGPIVKSSKVQITFRLDEDVFNWLQEVSKKNGLPYQTFMNSVLKKQMFELDSLEIRVSKIKRKLKLNKSA